MNVEVEVKGRRTENDYGDLKDSGSNQDFKDRYQANIDSSIYEDVSKNFEVMNAETFNVEMHCQLITLAIKFVLDILVFGPCIP